jgi:D-xylose transport system substrate-binding protein
MTVYKPIIPLASGAVDAAVKLAKREPLATIPFRNESLNPARDIPAILLEVVVVDKSNLMDTVIRDGYVKYEDVYKNVPEIDRPKRN